MKKLLLLFFCPLLAMSAFSQEVVSDRIIDGRRYVSTDEFRLTGVIEKVKQFYSVSAYQTYEGENVYMIDLRTNWPNPFRIEKGMKLLFKTTKEEIVMLEAIETIDIDAMTYLPGLKVSVYTGTSSYEISVEDVMKINEGITKVRIETTAGNIDKELYTDRLGKFIVKGYRRTRKALNTKRPDITDGF